QLRDQQFHEGVLAERLFAGGTAEAFGGRAGLLVERSQDRLVLAAAAGVVDGGHACLLKMAITDPATAGAATWSWRTGAARRSPGTNARRKSCRPSPPPRSRSGSRRSLPDRRAGGPARSGVPAQPGFR